MLMIVPIRRDQKDLDRFDIEHTAFYIYAVKYSNLFRKLNGSQKVKLF